MSTLNRHQQVDLLRLHVLREFLRFYGVDVDSKSFEVGSLLDRIVDREIDIVAAVKAIRNFDMMAYTIKVDEHLPSAVMFALKEGLTVAGTSWTQDGVVFNLNLKGGNSRPIGLLEAKKLVDLLRSLSSLTC